ncbi:uncharacterized protein LOC131232984 [Magnolia sinica]|uniref:uncharacterized protein LOC131232984 n=1 Tax=Magnolia sinica TaxID=86752 RepID=UPI00265AB8F0|nr:uncharacterized protein LOC131232984 [Magnolia sinica]XP_058085517.1 uncharacterized protein LOC131232984 [Magnolia sinica]
MSTILKKFGANGSEKPSPFEEQQEKINEVRRFLGELPDKLSIYCSDASISRYLRARSWNVKKATKMLKETLKWRIQYKPEEIRWEDVAHEAQTGKIYRSNYTDKFGRSVLVMKPGCQNTKSAKGQIRYLVYCMENAILNLPLEQEQMVWLIDFQGFSMSNISVKVTRETAYVLQEHYPERLGLAILYNPPKFFEPFYTLVKPFLEPKTCRKLKFIYSDDLSTKKIMEDFFNLEKLDSAFGGLNMSSFNINEYAERMREDDKRTPLFWKMENPCISMETPVAAFLPSFSSGKKGSESDDSGKEHAEDTSPHGMASNLSSDGCFLDSNASENDAVDIQSSVGTLNLEHDSNDKAL